MTTPLPAELVYETVTWTVVGVAEDAADADRNPDAQQITGTVTFTARPQSIAYVDTATQSPAAPVTVLPRPEVYSVVNGKLVSADGAPGVRLLTNNSPDTSPQGWPYHATYQLNDGYTFGELDFWLVSGTPVDLTTVVPTGVDENGTPVIRGPRGYTFSSVAVNGAGDLTLTLEDGTVFSPGNIKGPAGTAGTTGTAGTNATITGATASGLAAGASPTVTLGGTASARTFAFGIPAGAAGTTGAAATVAVGTVTTGAPGSSVSVTNSGTSQAAVLNFTIPQGAAGSGATDATTTANGSVRLAGDLSGTAAAPTVPGLAGKAATVHTHVATDLSNSTAVGRSLITAVDAAAARTAIGAGTGTSNLALGTTNTTAKAGDYTPPIDSAAGVGSMRTLGTAATQAAAGNDSRLSDARTPLAHTHAVADLTATGTKDTTTYLRGDGTWAVPPGGGGSASPDASTTVKGLVQLAGDLAGTAALPTVPGLAAKAPIASPTFTGTVGGITAAMVGLGSVNNTADTAKPVSTAQQAALDLKAPLASPAFTGTPTGITKTHVGLANVDNTADASKPVSTAQAAAIALKADLASPTFTGVPAVPTATAGTNTTQAASTAFVAALGALKAPLASPAFTGTPTGITATHVGLGNVNNTADSAKPVSTAQQAALDLKANAANPVFTGTVTIPDNALAIADTSGLQAALDAKAAIALSEGIKTHDGTLGGGTRPTGYIRVRWIGGTARPTNMVTGDVWERDA